MSAKELRERPSLIPAERAAELLDELIFFRVLEHIDVIGLQQLETQLWTTLIELEVDLKTRSPIAEARALIDRAVQRFLVDPVRVMSMGNDDDRCAACDRMLEGIMCDREANQS